MYSAIKDEIFFDKYVKIWGKVINIIKKKLIVKLRILKNI